MRRREHVVHRPFLFITESQRNEIHSHGVTLQKAHDDTFAVNRRHRRHAQVIFNSAHALPETTVL